MSLAEAFNTWVIAAAARDKAALESTLAGTVYFNELPPFKPHEDIDAFIAATVDVEIKDTYVDALVVDKPAKKITSRLVHFTEPRSDGSKGEWSKIVFVHFDDNGKVSRIHSLAENPILDQIREGVLTPPVGRSAKVATVAPLLSTEEIDTFYHGYIDILTNHTVAENFPKLVHEQFSHDVTPLSLQIFIDVVEEFSNEIQGLAFELKDLVRDEDTQQIGALVGLSGLPVKKFRGVDPTGKPADFDEYCIYTLKEGKIKSLWSVWDINTYKKCLSGEIDGSKKA